MIGENIEHIMSEINDAKIVAVTKKRSIEEIKEAVSSGIKIIGENRVREAKEKYDILGPFIKKNDVHFHYIGHLQRNKVKYAVKMFDLIQSVDSMRLAEEINDRAGIINKTQDILVQINIGKEEQKYGISPEEAVDFVNVLSLLDNLDVKGIMCMAPLFDDPEKTRPYFRKMKNIFDKTELEILSMGMSNDYKIAVEEGSNMVRIGRGIFGDYD